MASSPDADAELFDLERETEEEDTLDCARCLAEAKEYVRASRVLGECRSARGRFMRWYFDFLVSLVLFAA